MQTRQRDPAHVLVAHDFMRAHVPVHRKAIAPATRRAIKSVSMSKDGTFKVELHDRMKALADLGRHFGIFEKDHDQAGKAAAGTVAALIAAVQGKPLTPSS